VKAEELDVLADRVTTLEDRVLDLEVTIMELKDMMADLLVHNDDEENDDASGKD
jgi:hypothetical protein